MKRIIYGVGLFLAVLFFVCGISLELPNQQSERADEPAGGEQRPGHAAGICVEQPKRPGIYS